MLEEPPESPSTLKTQQGLIEQTGGQIDYYPEVMLAPHEQHRHGQLPV